MTSLLVITLFDVRNDVTVSYDVSNYVTVNGDFNNVVTVKFVFLCEPVQPVPVEKYTIIIKSLQGDSLRNRTKLDEGSSKSLKLGNLVYHSIP
jgi:hypothetical protein